MKLTAKSPCRVDLAGGTLDIWPLYLYHPNALTVNFAVNRYTSCTLETRADSRIVLCSRDLGAEESFESLAQLCEARRCKLPLPAYLVRYFARNAASRWTRIPKRPPARASPAPRR